MHVRKVLYSSDSIEIYEEKNNEVRHEATGWG